MRPSTKVLVAGKVLLAGAVALAALGIGCTRPNPEFLRIAFNGCFQGEPRADAIPRLIIYAEEPFEAVNGCMCFSPDLTFPQYEYFELAGESVEAATASLTIMPGAAKACIGREEQGAISVFDDEILVTYEPRNNCPTLIGEILDGPLERCPFTSAEEAIDTVALIQLCQQLSATQACLRIGQ